MVCRDTGGSFCRESQQSVSVCTISHGESFCGEYQQSLSVCTVPPVSTLCQVITALRIIMGEDGTDIGATKLKALRENSNFMRR